MLFASLVLCLHAWPIEVHGDLCRDLHRKEQCLLTLGSSALTSGKRYFRMNFAWGRLCTMKCSPCKTGGPTWRCRELDSAPQSLWGGGEGGQSLATHRRWPGLAGAFRDLRSLRLYLQGGHLTKQSAGRLVEGTLQTFLMLAQISPHREQIWHELREHINSIKRGNCRLDGGLQSAYLAALVCLNQLACQFPFFKFLSFSSFFNPVDQVCLCIKGNLQHIRLMQSPLKRLCGAIFQSRCGEHRTTRGSESIEQGSSGFTL